MHLFSLAAGERLPELLLPCDPGLFTQPGLTDVLLHAFWRPENAYISIDMTIYG